MLDYLGPYQSPKDIRLVPNTPSYRAHTRLDGPFSGVLLPGMVDSINVGTGPGRAATAHATAGAHGAAAP